MLFSADDREEAKDVFSVPSGTIPHLRRPFFIKKRLRVLVSPFFEGILTDEQRFRHAPLVRRVAFASTTLPLARANPTPQTMMMIWEQVDSHCRAAALTYGPSFTHRPL
ncbi:uncharacterized protein FIBRA_05191 [Fibroporia radiculosa]|uniref:Uncharacterized protein n=1 Tax=Fibroporia radiculosa TaxID=599839 RepID=J4IAK5_9APHY|nr:uncharacterized protein FIBRA_05191 [Fibroporia radiculosa]CCM03071.1 predicted protein [Fibroporia radiculosa]